MDKKIILTQETLQALKDELHGLETVERMYVEQALAEARALGDLSENAEYEIALDERARVESRIQHIQQILQRAEIRESDASGRSAET